MARSMKISIKFPNNHIRGMLKRLLQAGLHAADPMVAMRKALSVAGSTLQVGGRRYALKKFEQIVCVGAGKGAGRMAMALEERLGDRLSDGCVVVKDHSGCYTKKIQLLEASHPVPDARSVRAGKNIFTLAHSLTQRPSSPFSSRMCWEMM